MKLKYIFLFGAFFLLCSFHLFQIDDWVLQQEKKGIKIFTKKSKWSKLKDSKACMFLAGNTAEEIMNKITDFENQPKWVPRCKYAKIISKLGEDECIVHAVYNSPWPIADRDCVMRVKVIRNPSRNSITVLQTSEPNYLKEKAGTIRITQMHSSWELTNKNNGVEIINEYGSNPGGEIPEWIVNTQAVEYPLDMFINIKAAPVSKSKF